MMIIKNKKMKIIFFVLLIINLVFVIYGIFYHDKEYLFNLFVVIVIILFYIKTQKK
jgi:hypothetical protein